ncbi:MAG: protein translocase subunit SecD, partial [Burkholderiales bacterium]|nr:protein translocase subunit SecD [Burkholderiales bacterium]
MNRYPWWKYLIIAFAMFIGLIYTLPNFFGEAPAVQLSSGKATVKLTSDAVPQVEAALKQAGIKADFVEFDGNSIKARFVDTDTQMKARDAISKAFNPDPTDPQYIVALNLLSRSPQWLRALHAEPMYLGLDLRGGVHFLMQVDMKAALTQKLESLTGDIRTLLRDKDVRHSGIRHDGDQIIIRFRDDTVRQAARALIQDSIADLQW